MWVNFKKTPQEFLLKRIFTPHNSIKNTLWCYIKNKIDLLQFLCFWKEIKDEKVSIIIIAPSFTNLKDLENKYNIKIFYEPLNLYNFIKGEVKSVKRVSNKFLDYLKEILKELIGHKYKNSSVYEIKLKVEISKVINNQASASEQLKNEIKNIVGYLPEDEKLLDNLLMFLYNFFSD